MKYSVLFFCLCVQYITTGELLLHKPISQDITWRIIQEVVSSYDHQYSMPCSRIIQKSNNPIEYGWGRYPWGESAKREMVIPKKIRSLRMCLKAISLTNRNLLDYFSQEKTRQNIITFALQNNLFWSEDYCAQSLGYRDVLKKINYFYKKARSPILFSPEELKETWYLKSQIRSHQGGINLTVVSVAIDKINLEKIKELWPYVSHAQVELDWYFYRALNSLGKSKKKSSPIYARKIYPIVEFFLNQGANPDFKPTPLDSFSNPNYLNIRPDGARFIKLLQTYRIRS